MTTSYTISNTTTFTITHARHLASKVATDLKRMQRFYGAPSDTDIDRYEVELVALIHGGYLEAVTYGFRRNGSFIEPSIQYTAQELSSGSLVDDDPGRVWPGASTAGASFGSYLEYSRRWDTLTATEQDAVEARLPFRRSGAAKPMVEGYLQTDRTYSAGGRSLHRAIVRAW